MCNLGECKNFQLFLLRIIVYDDYCTSKEGDNIKHNYSTLKKITFKLEFSDCSDYNWYSLIKSVHGTVNYIVSRPIKTQDVLFVLSSD